MTQYEPQYNVDLPGDGGKADDHASLIARLETAMVTGTKGRVFDPTPLVKELVAARGWNQTDFGGRMGLSRTQISHLFTGRRKWSVEGLMNASEVLGIPISYFFGQGDEPDWLDEDLRELLKTATREDRDLVASVLRRMLSQN